MRMNGSQEYFEFLRKLENDPNFCYNYLSEISRNHPTYEQCLKTISQDAEISVRTAENIMKGRFELAEPIIAKSPINSFYYAKNIIKGRWEMGEKAIASDTLSAFDYAKQVLHGRFILGENAIAQDEHYSYRYATEIIKGKLPEEMHNMMLARRVAA